MACAQSSKRCAQAPEPRAQGFLPCTQSWEPCAQASEAPEQAFAPRGQSTELCPRGLPARKPRASAALPGAETGTGGGAEIEGGAALAARGLLDPLRMVFRCLCTREPWLPPWRELVAVYRRRGGAG